MYLGPLGISASDAEKALSILIEDERIDWQIRCLEQKIIEQDKELFDLRAKWNEKIPKTNA